ncbi:thioesterase II family protein [Pseudonocardia sp. ICBG1142]|uniref:thioesterase II family protein n=1 Tax=Pseudonocardia sp. ICBG1142 TaxID=2846760 RepID=UPI001CF71971|nr:alpha/beta fold hydrolase [Pseudonocardia sp. ICBG1142]
MTTSTESRPAGDPIPDDGTTPWIRRYHPTRSATRRLVCFPHAGGSASYFHPVSARFPDDDVVALQYPGRQDRRHEPCVTDIDELADLIAAELSRLSSLPTVFFGHSMGATLAFETAWRLERDGAGPGAVVVSGRRGPTTSRDEAVHELDDDGVLAEITLLDGTDSAVLADDEVLRMSLPAIRGDYTAIEGYRWTPGRTLSCPLVSLTGDADPRTTVEEAAAWSEVATGGFRSRVFPVGHFFIAAQAAAVQAELARELDGVAR